MHVLFMQIAPKRGEGKGANKYLVMCLKCHKCVNVEHLESGAGTTVLATINWRM